MTLRNPVDPRGAVPENPKDGDECCVEFLYSYTPWYRGYRYVVDPDPRYTHWYLVAEGDIQERVIDVLVSSRGKPTPMVRWTELTSC
jgi:hypothetical protein